MADLWFERVLAIGMLLLLWRALNQMHKIALRWEEEERQIARAAQCASAGCAHH